MGSTKRTVSGSPEAARRSALVPTRVRAYVPGNGGHTRRRAEYPRPNDRALLVHALVDDRDRLTLATSRELAGYVPIDEVLYASKDRIGDFSAYAVGRNPDVPSGIEATLRVRLIDHLGKLITHRFYRARVPLVAWDMGWTLGRLAAHTGRLKDSSDGFSITLVGCGTYNSEGKWRDSWDHPRFEVRPQGVGQLGVFVSCGLSYEEKKAIDENKRRHG